MCRAVFRYGFGLDCNISPLSFFNIFYVTFASAAGDGCEVIPEGLVYIT